MKSQGHFLMMIFLLKGSFKAENIPCAVIISGTSFLAIYKLLSVQGLFSLNRRPSTFLKQKTEPGSNPVRLVATHKLWFYDASRSRDDKVPPCVKLGVVEQGDIWRRFSQLPSFLLSTLLSYNEHNPQRQIKCKCVKIETLLKIFICRLTPNCQRLEKCDWFNLASRFDARRLTQLAASLIPRWKSN